MIQIELANHQSGYAVDTDRLIVATRSILEGEGIQAANISLAVVDDAKIHHLNRQYLDHDYPTDVLSFVLDNETSLIGEVIVSAETADRDCHQYGWSGDDELLLYVIHGVLHLVGYDDKQHDSERLMRERERYYLDSMGVPLPDKEPFPPSEGAQR